MQWQLQLQNGGDIASKIDNFKCLCYCDRVVSIVIKTSSAIAEIYDGPHGTSTHYMITKPRFSNFQNFLNTYRSTDRETDKVTYKNDYPSS